MLRPGARRSLGKLDEKVAAAVIELLDDLGNDPGRIGKPLRLELAGKWSARRGPYRVIYTVDRTARMVDVESITHRRDTYRRRGQQPRRT